MYWTKFANQILFHDDLGLPILDKGN